MHDDGDEGESEIHEDEDFRGIVEFSETLDLGSDSFRSRLTPKQAPSSFLFSFSFSAISKMLMFVSLAFVSVFEVTNRQKDRNREKIR